VSTAEVDMWHYKNKIKIKIFKNYIKIIQFFFLKKKKKKKRALWHPHFGQGGGSWTV